MREICYACVDAVCFLEERVYALDVVGVVGDGLGIVLLQAGVEVCCSVDHGCVCLCYDGLIVGLCCTGVDLVSIVCH
jgi:hypothetical protein